MAKKTTKAKSKNNKIADAAVKRRPWEDADLKVLREASKKGVATAVVAKQLKRTDGAVRQKAFEMELPMKVKRVA